MVGQSECRFLPAPPRGTVCALAFLPAFWRINAGQADARAVYFNGVAIDHTGDAFYGFGSCGARGQSKSRQGKNDETHRYLQYRRLGLSMQKEEGAFPLSSRRDFDMFRDQAAVRELFPPSTTLNGTLVT